MQARILYRSCCKGWQQVFRNRTRAAIWKFYVISDLIKEQAKLREAVEHEKKDVSLFITCILKWSTVPLIGTRYPLFFFYCSRFRYFHDLSWSLFLLLSFSPSWVVKVKNGIARIQLQHASCDLNISLPGRNKEERRETETSKRRA